YTARDVERTVGVAEQHAGGSTEVLACRAAEIAEIALLAAARDAVAADEARGHGDRDRVPGRVLDDELGAARLRIAADDVRDRLTGIFADVRRRRRAVVAISVDLAPRAAAVRAPAAGETSLDG